MTTNDTVSDARGQEQAALSKGQLQRIEERDRIEKKLREARRARWSLRRKRPASPTPREPGAVANVPEAQTAEGRPTNKAQEEAALTPGQRQRLEERQRVEKVVRDARRARWAPKRRKPLTAVEREEFAKAKAETRLERSIRALVVAALAVSVALIGFSIHALVQRGALNRDLEGLVDRTQQLAERQAAAMGQLQTTLEQLATEEAEQASRGAERLSMVEAATAAGFADVSARLGKIDALAEAVNTLAARETEHPQDAAPTPPSAFTERAVTLSSGRLAILLVPVEARRVVLLVPDVTSVDSDATTDPLRQVAEYLAARGSVVLRFDPEAAFEESLTTALGALDALLIQPEAAGMGVTLVAYAESVGIAVAEARPEVVNLVLLDPTARPAEPTQRLRQAVQVLGPIDEDALDDLQSWITAQDSPSP